MFSRRPDAVLHPQFWAEDGRVFFEGAYNVGWSESLFRPYGGYFHAVPRLGAAVALLAPLFAAPLVLNAIAIALQALPVNLLLSRQSDVWGSFRYRSVMAVVYLALPNCKELYANITNSQCLLALSAFLILAASPRKSAVSGIFGAVFLILFGLSGPYCILLLPIALFLAWKRHNRWQWTAAGIVTMTSLVQAWALLVLDSTGRVHGALGANLSLFVRILGDQVYLGTLVGGNSLGANPSPLLFAFFVGVALGGTIISGLCLLNAEIEMRLLLVFSAMVFCSLTDLSHDSPAAGIFYLAIDVDSRRQSLLVFPDTRLRMVAPLVPSFSPNRSQDNG